MAWTAPRTWTDAEVATAAMMNAHLRDAMLVLKVPRDDIGRISELSSETVADLDSSSVTGLARSGQGNAYTAGCTRFIEAGRLVLPVGTDKYEAVVTPVVWTNAVGVSVTGNSLTKTGTVFDWNAGAVSSLAIPASDGYVEMVAVETDTYRLLGLSNGDSDQGVADVDFAVILWANGAWMVFEAGVWVATPALYAPGDRFRIAVTRGIVTYAQNDVVFVTSAKSPAYPLLVDTSLCSQGATLNDVVLWRGLRRGIWVEGDYLHHISADQVTEWRYLGAYVSTPAGARPGSIWIEGEYLHYVDADGDERRCLSVGSAAGHVDAGAQPGSVWIESWVHWIQGSGARLERPGHADLAHEDGYSHEDVVYEDRDHYDVHDDAGHADSHGDSHWDFAGYDVDHTDHQDSVTIPHHEDAPHWDMPYEDEHGDSHSDVAHEDDHGDVAHEDEHDDHDDHDDVIHQDQPTVLT